jgi:hypothetical protein
MVVLEQHAQNAGVLWKTKRLNVFGNLIQQGGALTMRFATLLLLAPVLSFAGTWSGLLVDSNCYTSELRNTNKDPTTLERDMISDVRYCAPKPHTKVFSIVFPDWDNHELDQTGNMKAVELARQAGKKSLLEVRVTGDFNKDGSIRVSSLSLNATGPSH